MVTKQSPAEVEQDEITTPADLGFKTGQHREIEVEPVDPQPVVADAQGFVEIRMAETIEEFTYGNPHVHYKLEQGKRYRVPRHVAAYLWNLGYVYQR